MPRTPLAIGLLGTVIPCGGHVIAGGPCGPGSGPCNQSNGTPGCNDLSCCAAVCVEDPFCCEVEWDQICADAAQRLCGAGAGICGPGSGPCGQPNGTPGCNDAACCELVCDEDPFCCEVEWDQICADEAFDLCGAAGECCVGGELPEDEPCGDDTNGGCNSDPPAFSVVSSPNTILCGSAWAFAGVRDTDWYAITVGDGPVQATLQSEFDGVVFIVDGVAACDPTVIGDAGASNNCQPGDATAVVKAGSYVVFVATAGFDGTPCGGGDTAYRLTIDFTPAGPVCASAAGPCDEPNGTPGCEDPECCRLVCDRDPFCCAVEWDQVCADAAADLCDLGCTCRWDLDGDCVVGPSDLAALLASWGDPFGPADLAALLADWGCEG